MVKKLPIVLLKSRKRGFLILEAENDNESFGQTMVEFSFCMIIIAVLLLGMIRVFVWSGRDLIERREAHETILSNEQLTPDKQIRPVYYYSTRMNAAIDSDVYKN